MYTTHLHELTEFLKLHNPFFANGFFGAWQDGETGQVWAPTTNGRRPVFPEDQLGSMFYLRVSNIRFEEETDLYPVLDCQATGTDAILAVVLIATVRDADPLMLIQRLSNTLALFNANAVKLGTASAVREEVVLSELARADEAAKQAALQRLRNQAIISITFTFRTQVGFKALDCLPPICPTC